MLARSFGNWSLILILASPGWAAEVDEPVSPLNPRNSCPQCPNDSVEVAQLHKNADRLYAQFKPKEAANELLKILRVDDQNFEALIKLSRAYIDLGDMVPESGSDWKERRLKDYRTAEDYARRAIKANPNSTWGYFYLGASLGVTAVVPRLQDRWNWRRRSGSPWKNRSRWIRTMGLHTMLMGSGTEKSLKSEK